MAITGNIKIFFCFSIIHRQHACCITCKAQLSAFIFISCHKISSQLIQIVKICLILIIIIKGFDNCILVLFSRKWIITMANNKKLLTIVILYETVLPDMYKYFILIQRYHAPIIIKWVFTKIDTVIIC